MKSLRIVHGGNIEIVAVFSILILSVGGVNLLVWAAGSVWEYDTHGPWVDTIIFSELPDPNIACSSLIAGEVDLVSTSQVSTGSLLAFSRTPEINITESANPKEFLMFVNVSPDLEHHLSPGAAEACSDQRFRHALSHLIDRESIVTNVFDRMGEPAYSMYREDVQGVYANPDIEKFPYDVASANQILDEAGYNDIDGDGWRETPTGKQLSMEIQYYASKPLDGRTADYVSAAIKEKAKLNIVSLAKEDSKAVQDIWLNRVFDLYVSELAIKPVDHQPNFEWYLGTGSGLYNPSRHNNSEFDKYVEILESTLNETLAIEACHKALEIAGEDQNLIIIASKPIENCYRTDVTTSWAAVNGTEMMTNYWNYLNVRLKSGETGGTLRVALVLAGMALSPLKVKYTFTLVPYMLVYDPLIRSGWKDHIYGPVSPGLAESWTIEPATVDGKEGQVLTFNLVENATWHDGVPFTSADVKYTLETIMPNASQFGSYIRGVVRVETPDNYTAKVYMDKQSIFSMTSVGRGVPMLPKHIWEKYINAGQDPDTLDLDENDIIGTGPFKWSEWKRGEYCSITRDPNYYMGLSGEEPEPPPEPAWSLPVDPLTVGIIVVVVVVVGAGIIVIRRRGKP